MLRDGLEPSTMGMCEVGMWKANLEQMRAMVRKDASRCCVDSLSISLLLILQSSLGHGLVRRAQHGGLLREPAAGAA